MKTNIESRVASFGMEDQIFQVEVPMEEVSKYDFDVDLISGRYAVDAKSIMGIFSLDLSKPIKMEIYADNCPEFLGEVKPFIIE